MPTAAAFPCSVSAPPAHSPPSPGCRRPVGRVPKNVGTTGEEAMGLMRRSQTPIKSCTDNLQNAAPVQNTAKEAAGVTLVHTAKATVLSCFNKPAVQPSARFPSLGPKSSLLHGLPLISSPARKPRAAATATALQVGGTCAPGGWPGRSPSPVMRRKAPAHPLGHSRQSTVVRARLSTVHNNSFLKHPRHGSPGDLWYPRERVQRQAGHA